MAVLHGDKTLCEGVVCGCAPCTPAGRVRVSGEHAPSVTLALWREACGHWGRSSG